MREHPIILVVDDMAENLKLLGRILNSREYEVRQASGGKKAIEMAVLEPPDLVLLDIDMPDMNGFDVCRRLKEDGNLKDVPVIFISGLTETHQKVEAFRVGGVDYISKPFQIKEILARINTHLELAAAREAIRDRNRFLEREVSERTREISDTQDIAIHSLAVLAEYRDNETGGHILRTQRYVHILATHLSSHPRFSDYLSPDIIDLLFKSSPLHDLGKVCIPDRILLKPGALDIGEFEQMKLHTILGSEAISSAERRLGRGLNISFLNFAKEIAATHHEKWNGTGYPMKLCEEQIPISGRLMALADVYDALVSKRVYKPPFTHEKAVEIISKGDWRVVPEQFDPDILKAFMELHETFRYIAIEYADSEEERQMLSRSSPKLFHDASRHV
jgi:putative two-component system response regulator